MGTIQHEDAIRNHTIHRWTVADEAERLALTTDLIVDKWNVCLQLDNMNVYVLTSTGDWLRFNPDLYTWKYAAPDAPIYGQTHLVGDSSSVRMNISTAAKGYFFVSPTDAELVSEKCVWRWSRIAPTDAYAICAGGVGKHNNGSVTDICYVTGGTTPALFICDFTTGHVAAYKTDGSLITQKTMPLAEGEKYAIIHYDRGSNSNPQNTVADYMFANLKTLYPSVPGIGDSDRFDGVRRITGWL